MVAVHEISWEEASAPDFEHTTRQAFWASVDQVAARAKATLPESSGRVEKAVAIVLAGDVELLADGHEARARPARAGARSIRYRCTAMRRTGAAGGATRRRTGAGARARQKGRGAKPLRPPMQVRKYGGRYWAVYNTDGTLVCVCLYKKGALEVVRRLSGKH